MTTATPAAEIGFIEEFALSDDREAALEKLIPGSEEHYYYHALHYQHGGRLDEVERLLEAWIGRLGRTRLVQEIEARQALLRYPHDPAAALRFLRERLDVRFDHQRRVAGVEPTLPTRLDPDRISRAAFTTEALRRHEGTVDGFETQSLERAARLELDDDQRRSLLARLERPDVPGLARLVVEDLRTKRTRGFGSHPIHARLLLAQLDECLRLEPELANDERFVITYLARLAPSPDVDWRHDAPEREAWLERLQAFVSNLAPAHNSLKAHVLYHRLAHDRALGVFDKERFLAYLRLPRRAGYVNPKFLGQSDSRKHRADLGKTFEGIPFPAIRTDEELVRSYLAHFLRTEDSYEPYATWIDDSWLRRVFAETKILAGVGDMERWYSMLTPGEYAALRDRVDIDFAPTNPSVIGPREQIGIDVWVKNVPQLLVKVFEINALNYYKDFGRELDTSIDLDGLVASVERTYEYTEPPLRRVARHFEFPELEARGTYVIELIGGGIASRALVRRGGLSYLSEDGPAGHYLTVVDESGRPIADPRAWLGGHEYTGGDDGVIVIPYSTEPGVRPLVLYKDNLASIESMAHRAESYALDAGIWIERESLLSGTTAEVVVRPTLELNGRPVSLELLEEVRLTIQSTDRDGVSSTVTVADFPVTRGKEATHAFKVPDHLRGLTVTLEAKVEVISRNRKDDLSDSASFGVNGIEDAERIEDLHLGRPASGYELDLLGRSGEPKANRPVQLEIKHREFRDTMSLTLRTDERGRASLGELTDVEWVVATGPEGTARRWRLGDQHAWLPRTLQGPSGDALRLPYPGVLASAQREEFALFELRSGTYARDRFDALALEGGYLELRGLEPGDYELRWKSRDRSVAVRVTDATSGGGWVVSPYRRLERSLPAPIHIERVDVEDDEVLVHLSNARSDSRLHVAVTRFLPEFSIADRLAVDTLPEPQIAIIPPPETQYVAGRDIGEEYRYVLERQQHRRFPGNLLTRPSLLLNPWDLRDTSTTRVDARAGGTFAAKPPGATASRAEGRDDEDAEAAGERAAPQSPSLDFLGTSAVVLLDLEAEDGVVRIDRESLGAGHELHLLAADALTTSYRRVSLPEIEAQFADRTLLTALEPGSHYTQQTNVTSLGPDESLTIEDISTAEFEIYDSLDKVFGLYSALSGNSTLAEFSFILGWPGYSAEKKRELYDRYASHELHFFIHEKDPEFFEEVIRPYLANKYHKTFLDHWLLGEDLTSYLEPWAWSQLNVVERILLARRIDGEAEATRRAIDDLFDALPPDAEAELQQFLAALGSRSLELSDEYGLAEARQTLRKGLEAKRALGVGGGAAGANGVERFAAPVEDAEHDDAMADLDALAENEALSVSGGAFAGRFARGADIARRRSTRGLYRSLDPTKEWAENNYYRLPIESQNADLVTVNAFWNDFSAKSSGTPFTSTHFAKATRNFTEMMLALSALDLPFEAAKHTTDILGTRFKIDAAGEVVIFHREIRPAEPSNDGLPILVSQNFYRHGDRYRHVGGEKLDKYVTDEFIVQTIYGGHVVVTNPTSSRQKIEVLLQIPHGSIPVAGTHATRSSSVTLEPYRTWTQDHFFYFPAAGDRAHLPVHVASGEALVAFAEPFTFHVVSEPSQLDEESWNYVSQSGTEEQVIAFLQNRNLNLIDLGDIAWRMKDRDFFRRTIAILERRHAFDATLWSYSLLHDEPAAIGEYLRHRDDLVQLVGGRIESPILALDPVERRTYQHLEYWPLVNARAHRLGARRQILNDRFFAQYTRFLEELAYAPSLDDEDRLSATYYLFLQDRVDEALAMLDEVKTQNLVSGIQYDYAATYASFYTENLRQARALASKYASHPVERWRLRFANALAQLDEIEGSATPGIVDDKDTTQEATQLAATEPFVDFDIVGEAVQLRSANIESCDVNYYRMDVELLFSRNPFVRRSAGQFAYIRPNLTTHLDLSEAEEGEVTFPIPESLRGMNLLVEVVSGSARHTEVHLSNRLDVQLVENYAQVRIVDRAGHAPLSKVYVKVFARTGDGRIRFYKDGYTDLRGRFDYGSLSTDDLGGVDRFSLLVLSDSHGASILEARPPQL